MVAVDPTHVGVVAALLGYLLSNIQPFMQSRPIEVSSDHVKSQSVLVEGPVQVICNVTCKQATPVQHTCFYGPWFFGGFVFGIFVGGFMVYLVFSCFGRSLRKAPSGKGQPVRSQAVHSTLAISGQ